MTSLPSLAEPHPALVALQIKRGEYEFLRPYWDPISDAAKDLISRMLTIEPEKRITCEEVRAGVGSTRGGPSRRGSQQWASVAGPCTLATSQVTSLSVELRRAVQTSPRCVSEAANRFPTSGFGLESSSQDMIVQGSLVRASPEPTPHQSRPPTPTAGAGCPRRPSARLNNGFGKLLLWCASCVI